MPVTCACGSDIQANAFELLPEGFVERAVERALAGAASSLPKDAILEELEDQLVDSSLNLWLCSDCGRLSVFGQANDSRFAESYAPDGGKPQWTIGH